ncbi:hypothetical protein CRI94_01405 [Longibacter salinarum]|uniref:Uncharacterized protein n=1 Tax=Longibacter salinarum TaxID=1850348 RepID=A0A2A8D2V1_9BACT|nr:hypothetical protein CRI94_01405 [Longibacter salinarum]
MENDGGTTTIYEYKKSHAPLNDTSGSPDGGADASAAVLRDRGDGEYHIVSVYDGRTTYDLKIRHGRTLRAVLQEHNLSPHGGRQNTLTGRGAVQYSACAVDIDRGEQNPDQWLDAFLASRNVGRLSCEIEVKDDMSPASKAFSL